MGEAETVWNDISSVKTIAASSNLLAILCVRRDYDLLLPNKELLLY
jgi:hypothetical protein